MLYFLYSSNLPHYVYIICYFCISKISYIKTAKSMFCKTSKRQLPKNPARYRFIFLRKLILGQCLFPGYRMENILVAACVRVLVTLIRVGAINSMIVIEMTTLIVYFTITLSEISLIQNIKLFYCWKTRYGIFVKQ